jgi:hypothetical protein
MLKIKNAFFRELHVRDVSFYLFKIFNVQALYDKRFVNLFVFQEPPIIVTAIPHQRTIELSWTIKPCSQNDVIKGFEIKTGDKTFKAVGNKPSYNLTNLKPYTEYNVSVRAIKQVGYGVWSKTKRIKTTIAGISICI